jgi:TIR domain
VVVVHAGIVDERRFDAARSLWPPSSRVCSVDRAAMPGVFISYRRRDTDGHAGRLAEDLRARYGDEQVFIDVDSIEGGVDFEKRIEHALDVADVAFVLIGDEWLGRRDGAPPRIQDPDDWVRREVSTMLRRSDVVVVPVLVEGAPLPSADDLPPDLARLPRLQTSDLSTRGWSYQLPALCELVERSAPQVAGGPVRRILGRQSRGTMVALTAAVIAAAVAVVALVANGGGGGDGGSQASCENRAIPASSRAALAPAAGASGPALKGVHYGSCDGTPWAMARFPGNASGVFRLEGGKWTLLGSIDEQQCTVPAALLDAWRLPRCAR